MRNYIKGILIGIGKILPGISGSMLAISFGVYKHMLYCISNIKLLNSKDIIFMGEICLGITTSIFFLSKLVLILINNYFHIIVSIFTGIIIGGQIKNVIKINIKYLIIFIIIFIFIININLPKISININPLSLFFIGILEAFAMIIPGVSGTSIFLYLGVYEKVLNILTDIGEYKMLLCFIFGVSFGILLLSKVISNIIEKNEKKFESIAVWFTIVTSLSIFKNIFLNIENFSEIMIILFLFFISLIASFKLNR